MYTHIYIYIHIHIHTYIHIYIYIHIHIHVYIYIYIHMRGSENAADSCTAVPGTVGSPRVEQRCLRMGSVPSEKKYDGIGPI